MLKYYLGIANPEKLSNRDWAENIEILRMIRKDERSESTADFAKLFGGKKK